MKRTPVYAIPTGYNDSLWHVASTRAINLEETDVSPPPHPTCDSASPLAPFNLIDTFEYATLTPIISKPIPRKLATRHACGTPARSRITAFAAATPGNAPFVANPGLTSWRQATGETTQAELVAVPFSFTDPARNLRTYMIVKGLPLNGATTQNEVAKQFLELCKEQRKGNWDTDLLANKVNDFIREGFGM